MKIRLNCLLLLAACLVGCSKTPTSSWTDVAGRAQSPLDAKSSPATVFLFIAPQCPISNGYAPELARIAKAYSPRGVRFFAVHSDPSVTVPDARKHATDYALPFPVLLDPDQSLAKRYGATVTPEAVVIDRTGVRRYLGRIDDINYSFGRRRSAPTTHELTDALDAVLSGQTVAHPRVAAIGCEIAPPPPPAKSAK